jgi:purine-binding chemotaxis protein CheW
MRTIAVVSMCSQDSARSARGCSGGRQPGLPSGRYRQRPPGASTGGRDLGPADTSASAILLRLDDGEYALPLGCVVEVVRMAALAPVPDAPGFVLGLLDLRGRVVPVVDLRRRLGLPAVEPGLSTTICVVEAGGRGFGLVADAVTDVRPLLGPVEALEVAPDGSPVDGVTHVDDRLVTLLDPGRLAGTAGPVPGEPARAGGGR